MATYDQKFFDYVNEGAVRSARRLLKLLTPLRVQNVLDVGCGQGAWLSVWRELGVEDVTGVDGDYVDRHSLRIDAESFVATDLSMAFDLRRKFDIAQCLEVAEHLPENSAASLVESLTRHADVILFSAAAKGQGGENHINEQPYDYWRRLFAEHRYVVLDYIRPQVLDDTSVEPWYRYNTFLYVRNSKLGSIPERMQAALVSDNELLRDLSPLPYRMRKAFVRFLPVAVISRLSRLRIAVLRSRQRF